jgi:hypothetical protein
MYYPGIDTTITVFERNINESLPLAQRPHLLTANAREQQMFGYTQQLRTRNEHTV